MNYSLTFIILLTFIFVFYINTINNTNSIKYTIKINLFNGLSFLFFSLFLYYYLYIGIKCSIFTTLVTWCLFVVATPIPEAGLLVSIPVKNVFNIELDKTQIVVSILSLFFLFYSYYHFKNILTKSIGGRFLIKIIHYRAFSIFITSILSSISLSYLLNEGIDHTIYKKSLLIRENLFYIGLFIPSFLYYFIVLRQLNHK